MAMAYGLKALVAFPVLLTEFHSHAVAHSHQWFQFRGTHVSSVLHMVRRHRRKQNTCIHRTNV